MFSGFLKLKPSCDHCGTDFTSADVGDGASVFVMLIVGAIVVPLLLIVELAAMPPFWVHAVIWPPVASGLMLLLLRPFKATLFALQFKHDAHEARLDD